MDQPAFLSNLFGLNSKTIIVTGGNGLLGTQFAETIIKANGRVIVFDRSLVPNERLQNIIDYFPHRISYWPIDILNESAVSRAVEDLFCDDIPYGLVNNAGWAGLLTDSSSLPSEKYPTGTWEEIIKTNLTGSFICSKIVADKMIEKKQGGVIVNIASIYGLVSPDQRLYNYNDQKTGTKFFKAAAYGSSKAGLIYLTKQNATEWSQYKIRVNALCPGGVGRPNDDPDFVKAYSERTPLGRMARADEYNGPLLFLLSEASSYMTGATLVVDGGWTIW